MITIAAPNSRNRNQPPPWHSTVMCAHKVHSPNSRISASRPRSVLANESHDARCEDAAEDGAFNVSQEGKEMRGAPDAVRRQPLVARNAVARFPAEACARQAEEYEEVTNRRLRAASRSC